MVVIQVNSLDSRQYESYQSFENEDSSNIQAIALNIQISAIVIATSALLLFFPQIETITVSIFLFAHMFRYRFGLNLSVTITVGWEVVASLVFGFSGILFPFKMVGWLLVYHLGIVSRKLNMKGKFDILLFAIFATILWDLILLIGIPLTLSSSLTEFIPLLLSSFITGIPFTILHIIGNVTFFAAIPMILETVMPLLNKEYPQISVKHNE